MIPEQQKNPHWLILRLLFSSVFFFLSISCSLFFFILFPLSIKKIRSMSLVGSSASGNKSESSFITELNKALDLITRDYHWFKLFNDMRLEKRATLANSVSAQLTLLSIYFFFMNKTCETKTSSRRRSSQFSFPFFLCSPRGRGKIEVLRA